GHRRAGLHRVHLPRARLARPGEPGTLLRPDRHAPSALTPSRELTLKHRWGAPDGRHGCSWVNARGVVAGGGEGTRACGAHPARTTGSAGQFWPTRASGARPATWTGPGPSHSDEPLLGGHLVGVRGVA